MGHSAAAAPLTPRSAEPITPRPASTRKAQGRRGRPPLSEAYLGLVLAAPSPGNPRPPDGGRRSPTGLQAAQRRLAFALSTRVVGHEDTACCQARHRVVGLVTDVLEMVALLVRGEDHPSFTQHGPSISLAEDGAQQPPSPQPLHVNSH